MSESAPTVEIAKKVLDTVDAGLSPGLGQPVPGQMCVEAAVCYAYGLPHSDNPPCVSPALRKFKIRLNDKNWSSPQARAAGLRRLAIAQLGSVGMDDKEFTKRLAEKTIRIFVPKALRAAAEVLKKTTVHKQFLTDLETAADQAEELGTIEAARTARAAANAANAANAAAAADAAAYAAYAAYAAAAYAAAYAADAADAAYAADAAAYAECDRTYTEAAEMCISVLREMNVPGIALMDQLAPLPS